ncbi:unnamed protein product, partial [Mesorhabditis spiculigera]
MFSPARPIPADFEKNVRMGDAVAYCTKCKHHKPPRTHHCKVCGICVMRMDHHCPILQSCVHHHNYKFYLLYLTVPCCLGIFVAIWLRGTFWELLLVLFGGGELSFVDNAIFGAYTNALVIAVGVGWLAREHLFLARYNRSSIEQTVLESTDFQDGDKAELENICTAFGVGPRLPHRLAVLQRVVDGIYWLLPLNGNVPDDSINYNSRLVDPQSIALG